MRPPRLVRIAFITAIVGGFQTATAQEKFEITITQQPQIIYLSSAVMQAEKLVEKKAAALGVDNLKVNWLTFTSGGASTDALLAGQVDVVNTGTGNMLLLWDRTKGAVKGIVATATAPMALITRSQRIRTLFDYTEKDKIAVPTLRVSTQAIILQIAAEQQFGEGQWARLDSNTVQMSNPDAATALTNPVHEVTSAFAVQPFFNYVMKNVPGVHVVLRSEEVMGGPLTNSSMFTTAKFADANPLVIRAIRDAVIEAERFIHQNPERAVDLYKAAMNDRTPTSELVELVRSPGFGFSPKPQGTFKFATHLNKVGTLKMKPISWTEYYFPSAHDLGGN